MQIQLRRLIARRRDGRLSLHVTSYFVDILRGISFGYYQEYCASELPRELEMHIEMKLSGFYSLLVITTSAMLSYTSSSSGNYSITMTLSTEIAKEDDLLTAVCDVSSNTGLEFMIIWVKNTIEDNKMIEIATNNHINDPFKITGRYAAGYEVVENGDTNHVRFTLNISDLRSEDSGLLTCKLGNSEPENFKRFTVQVPVQKIWWASFDNEVHLTDAQTVTFKEGDKQKFACHVNGSYPLATVQVFLGDQDITHLFDVNNSLKRGIGPKGLQPLSYDTDAVSRSTIIGYHNMTKPLKCVAKLQNSDLSKETTINVNMTEYSPTFLCKDRMQAKLHEWYFNLTCKVHANPGVKDVKFHWISDDANNNDTLDVGEKNSDISANTTMGEDKDEIVMIMTISRITPQHFARKYIFEAENDISRVTHVIQLERDTSPAFIPQAGGCSFHFLKNNLLLILLLSSFVFSFP